VTTEELVLLNDDFFCWDEVVIDVDNSWTADKVMLLPLSPDELSSSNFLPKELT